MVNKLNNRIVLAFGRFNPPTLGHAILITEVLELAKYYQCQHKIITSTTQDNIRNPLSIDRKLYYLNKINPKVNFGTSTNLIESIKLTPNFFRVSFLIVS